MNKSAELRAARAEVIREMKKLHDAAKAENRDLTDTERDQWGKLETDETRLQNEISIAERGERVELLDAELKVTGTRKVQAAGSKLVTDLTPADRKRVLRAWALAGTDRADSNPDTLYRAANYGVSLASRTLSVRALSKGTNSAGGYDVPTGFASEIEQKLKYYCPLRQFVRVVSTDSGEDLQWPVVDDTGSVAAIVSEAGSIGSSTDPVFSQVTFKNWKYASPIVKVSVELLQDAATDIESLLADMFAERMGRGQEAHFLTGDGTTQPQGLVTAAGAAAVNLASGNALTFAKLKSLEHSLDIAYRANASWLMHDATFAAIEQLVDSQGRPLFVQNLTGGSEYKLFGYPVRISNSFTAYTGAEGDNATMILFGDLNRYVIRDVSSSMQVARLDELYAANGQVGFVLLQRTDGRMLNASAVKALASYDAP